MTTKNKNKVVGELSDSTKVDAYCVKCKENGVEMSDKKIIRSGGRLRISGKHAKCGTTLNKFTSVEKLKELVNG